MENLAIQLFNVFDEDDDWDKVIVDKLKIMGRGFPVV